MDLDTPLWVRPLAERPAAARRLLFFPHAGGAASYFRPLGGTLPPAIEPLAIQYPGRQDRRREPPVSSIDELAEALFAVLGDSPAHTPTVFFGHSMGAVVAFEVIRRYERAGRPGPLGLIASGRRAPVIRRPELLHTRTDAEVVREMRRLNGTESDFLDDPDVRAMILPAIRADYRVIETYEFDGGPPVNVPVHAFVGTADPRVTVDEAAAWQRHTAGEFRLHTFPGGHFYLTEVPAAGLADEIASSMRSFAEPARTGPG